jgi:hypothetical protein
MSRLHIKPLTRETLHELAGQLDPPTDDGKELVRRCEGRACLPDSVTIHLSGKGWERSFEGFCRNMSTQGVGVFVRRTLPVNQVVQIDLNLPDRIYTTRAAVVYSRRVAGGYNVGLKFLLCPSDRRAPKELLAGRNAFAGGDGHHHRTSSARHERSTTPG